MKKDEKKLENTKMRKRSKQGENVNIITRKYTF